MSPKKNSRRSSPKKEIEASIAAPISVGLKLRLKVKEAVFEDSVVVNDNPVEVSKPLVPKIKLNFSRSNESVVAEEAVPIKSMGKRGRPKKDKSAVLAAAIAASQPNELETEERKSRRRAAEDKIKRSASGEDIVMMEESLAVKNVDGEAIKKRRGRRPKNFEEGEEGGDDNKRRRRRRRRSSEESEGNEGNVSNEDVGRRPRRQPKAHDFIDITEGPSTHNTRNAYSNTAATTPSVSSVPYNPHENEFIQRSKTFLNIAMQHDSFLYTSMLSGLVEGQRFKGVEDVVERLVPFHMGISAGQYSEDELSANVNVGGTTDHVSTFNSLQDRYRTVIHSQSSKKVPTELLLLEQRLCLEEEKFLLVKLKNEYAAKFLKSTSTMGSSMSSVGTSGRSSMAPSRSDSVINE